MNEKKNYNEHRKGKRSFQANLSSEENELVNKAKATLNIKTDRELLLVLCEKHVSYTDAAFNMSRK